MKKMTKMAIVSLFVLSLFLGVAFISLPGNSIPVFMTASAEPAGSGICGIGVRWSVENDTLIIYDTGIDKGETFDYDFSDDDYPRWIELGLTYNAIVVEDGVKILGSNLFRESTGVTSVSLPDSVTSIGAGAFRSCESLPSITVPDGVSEIKAETFYGCSSLGTVYLPASITSIGDNAFYNCPALTNIYFAGGRNEWNAISVGSGNEVLSSVPVNCAYRMSDSFGEGNSWTLDYDGHLTVTGSGDMGTFSSEGGEQAPWYGWADDIVSAEIDPNFTNIASYVFLNA